MRTRTKRFVFAGIIGALYLYCFPYFAKIRSANELPRIYLTMAMVDEGRVSIDTGVKRWGTTVDVSPSCDWEFVEMANWPPTMKEGKGLAPFARFRRHNCHSYSNKAPGSSILAVPGYLVLKAVRGLSGHEPTLGEITWVARIATGVIPTCLFLLLLWRFLRRFAPNPEIRRLVIFGYAMGSMAMTYSVLFIAHQLSAVCIGSAYMLAVWVCEEELPRPWLWMCGFAAGCAPLVDYQAAFAGVPVAAYLLYCAYRKPHLRKGVLYAIGGAAVPVAVLLSYHHLAFGGALRTGYDASVTFASYHQQGFLGLDQWRWEAFWGSTFAADNGLFFLAPMWLLAIPGWVLMFKKGREFRRHAILTLSVVTLYLVFISSIIFWRGGWQLGPRYITAMLPFMLLPVAVFANWAWRRPLARALTIGLVFVGVVIYALSSAIFPHYPEEFDNPFFALILRLIADGHSAPNAAFLLGLRGTLSLMPYLVLLGVVTWWLAAPNRESKKVGIAGLAITLVILLAYSTIPDPVKDASYQRKVRVMPK